MMARSFWWLLGLALACAACGPAPASGSPSAPPPPASAPAAAPTARAVVQPLNPPVQVRYGSQEQVSGVGMYLAQEKGYFREEGLEVEFIRVGGGPDAAPALATGDLAFSQGAMDPATFNAILRGVPLRFVAHLTMNRDDAVSSGLMVRQDLIDSGRFQEVPDLKGMTVSVGSGSGSTAEMFMSRLLEKHGLSLADIQHVPISYVDTATALTNKAVDAAWQIQPFISTLEARGIAKMITPLTEVYPGAVTNALIISPVFAQSQPEAARRFVTAQMRGQREFWHAFIRKDTPGAQDEIIDVLTKYTPVKDPQQWRETVMPGMGLNGELPDAMVDEFQSYFVKAGSQHEKIPVSQVVDHSYVGYALERLGRESY